MSSNKPSPELIKQYWNYTAHCGGAESFDLPQSPQQEEKGILQTSKQHYSGYCESSFSLLHIKIQSEALNRKSERLDHAKKYSEDKLPTIQ